MSSEPKETLEIQLAQKRFGKTSQTMGYWWDGYNSAKRENAGLTDMSHYRRRSPSEMPINRSFIILYFKNEKPVSHMALALFDDDVCTNFAALFQDSYLWNRFEIDWWAYAYIPEEEAKSNE